MELSGHVRMEWNGWNNTLKFLTTAAARMGKQQPQLSLRSRSDTHLLLEGVDKVVKMEN